MNVKLLQEWIVGARIGGGGFGDVHEATSEDGVAAAIKFVPKAPGSQREMLFVSLGQARNLVPVLDSGETATHWVIVMPRADRSLRQELTSAGGQLGFREACKVVVDVVTSLSDLDGRVVHRDLKPENVLLLAGRWCLADFGISRYAEATTAADTQKHAMSQPYAAPERWRIERATNAADIYSLGVMMFEMLTGSLPFPGPAGHDFRLQHLEHNPPAMPNGPAALKSLVAECLYKAPEARPSPANLLKRIEVLLNQPVLPGLALLEQANLDNVSRLGEQARVASSQRSEADRRTLLIKGATSSFEQISAEMRDTLASAASSAQVQKDRYGGWLIRLGAAELRMHGMSVNGEAAPSAGRRPVLDVIAHTMLTLDFPSTQIGYGGRGHSLWFCNAQEENRYGWFETAFMHSPFSRKRTKSNPIAFPPSPEAEAALSSGINMYDVAWPFTRLAAGELDEFVARWADWFGRASIGGLDHPSTMPERNTAGSWRQG